MLAQGRNGAQNPGIIPVTQPQVSVQAPATQMPALPPPPPAAQNHSAPLTVVNGNTSPPSGSAQGSSETGSGRSEDRDQLKSAARGKGKRNTPNGTATNGRRKAEDAPTKGPAKKAKTASIAATEDDMMSDDDDEMDDDDDDPSNGSTPKSKMTDEEKRKNFLERNR